MERVDLAVVGGGIVGLATAYRFQERFPGRRAVVLEKEPEPGMHQTGHNSGVLHSGIYYDPGSLKAANCRAGREAMEAFCEREGIPYDRCGKVIVAVEERELPALERIAERGRANGVPSEVIDRDRLRELEPHAAGIRAIHVPETGIVDFREVALRLARRVGENGGAVLCDTRVAIIADRGDRVIVAGGDMEVEARCVVTAAGLQGDRVTRLSGRRPQARIVPFRGEYYLLKPEAHHLFRNLIYPVPDPRFPFLGVHFTRTIQGGRECGPNAVLAFSREGYRFRDVRPGDLAEALRYRGFQRMAARYWRVGLAEMWRSSSKGGFVRALRRLIPELRAEHLEAAPAGVRAQAVTRDGRLADDFLITDAGRVINVENAPSPAATASLNIGRLIVDRVAPRMG